MKIIKLQSENIKKLKAVELELDEKENVVIISGKNGQGKSSIMDSIWYALGGKDSLPAEPVRHGEKRATVSIDLGEMVVTRTFSSSGTTLTVENKEGAIFRSPQSMLDDLVGKLSFDPLEFASQSPKEQRETLLGIMGVNVDELETRRKELFNDRTMIGREVTTLKGKLAGKDEPAKGAPTEIIDIFAMSEELTELKNDLELHKDDVVNLKVVEVDLTNLEIKVKQLKQKEKDLKESISKVNVDKLQQDIDKLSKTLSSAEEVNANVRANEEYLTLQKEYEAKEEEYKGYTEDIEKVDQQKNDLLHKAPSPLPGLSISEDGVIFNEIPFEQLSSAEKLKVSLSIAMAANPKIRVIRIMDGSLLDSDNMKVIKQMADKNDFQVWIEVVDSSGKVGVYIEEGEIKKDNR